MFEEFGKNTSIRASQLGAPPLHPPPPPSAKSQVFYAIVQHDFQAERQDELEAKRGDAITVVAQSNREWFVAKPIGRLGRPGLIPVSFVEIHDPATGKPIIDVEGLMDRGELPKVEDWKKAMLTYKQNSIPLGVIDTPSKSSLSDSPYSPQATSPTTSSHTYHNAVPPRPPTPELLPEGILLSADVVSFHYEMDEYWFRIDALYQPYPESESSSPPPAKQLILFRVYNDFYDFQVALLETFPREGGRHPPHPRILPFMPGPAETVDDILTATRRLELDAYVHDLCQLSNIGAHYVLEHRIVREFLSLKPGDVEQSVGQAFDTGSSVTQDDNTVVNDIYDRELAQKMGGLRTDDERSDGSDYGEERYNPSIKAPSYGERVSYAWKDQRPPLEAGTQMFADSPGHERSNSSASFHSRSYSPHPERTHSSQAARNGNHSHTSLRYENSYPPGSSTPQSVASHHSSQKSSRSRSQSNATSNFNNPSISAANPQTAFVKIKIFDRVADDLIAIRVHPKVTHLELMEKVQGRLGGEVSILRYRDSLTNTFVGLDNDVDLRVWMEGTGKHVLYAD
ncbi:hypothetical protein AGABI1DRAFT_113465 [Agaricus bisporus var. burnettii JB137-S8]|uniref:Scd2/ral3 n=1 Tax=Agaricus bisporus var. burnettii (strain JB137-S8 / ATCC MYA-4627 / FGSC 10392) TaxID=597362 RepID=K5W0E5_AGABU|nr:uncharacterized protein AGABI1DRAFT_113465 [Agaricus bisporus var. burnettii JB137-S8]EKM80264.1 hypothetical protein AGABI1DRAFT_113465 [Agaricus bisporus var. burnettii JB137-S8]